MIKKANISWNARQYTKMIEKGSINFDNAVQRGLTWDKNRKSLLIHSMITGFPIPAFYAARDENGYSMLDGKQRSNAIKGFITNEFALVDDMPECFTEDGEKQDISGLMFSELPEEFQDNINSYGLTIYYFEGITDEEIAEMFFRLNNGKALSAIELTRVKAASFDQIKQLSKHQLFTDNLTESALNKYTNEDITMKSWIMLFDESDAISLETKYVRDFVQNNEMTADQAETISNVFERLNNIKRYISILAEKAEDKAKVKSLNKVIKTIFKRMHFVSLVSLINQSIREDIPESNVANWIINFYGVEEETTIDPDYNDACLSGTAKAENVQMRQTMLAENYKDYFRVDMQESA